jgi:hypothetical protein
MIDIRNEIAAETHYIRRACLLLLGRALLGQRSVLIMIGNVIATTMLRQS